MALLELYKLPNECIFGTFEGALSIVVGRHSQWMITTC